MQICHGNRISWSELLCQDQLLRWTIEILEFMTLNTCDCYLINLKERSISYFPSCENPPFSFDKVYFVFLGYLLFVIWGELWNISGGIFQMLHGVPPTIGGIPSLQICHKFKMFQRISFKNNSSLSVSRSLIQSTSFCLEIEKSEMFPQVWDFEWVSMWIKFI